MFGRTNLIVGKSDGGVWLIKDLGGNERLQSLYKKMKFSIKDFFSKCDQIRSFLRIWSHLLKKSSIENFIFCAVNINYWQAGVPDPISMSKELIQKKIAERRFLEQLLDGKKLDKFSIPIPIKCDLRKYQQVHLFLSSQILFLTVWLFEKVHLYT